jgi:hypothetical protein
MGEGPSALEQRLNDRMTAGTLTVRGADMLKGIEEARRTDLTNRYGFDTRSADNKYSTDAQTQNNILNNQTQLHGINTQAASNQYSTDAQTQNNILNNQTQLHGINTQAASNQYNTDAQTQNNILDNQTQMFGHRTNAAADRYRTDSQADTSRYNTDVGAQTQLQQSQNQMLSNMYITDANNYAASIGNRSRPYGLRNGGEIHAANGFAQYTPRGFGAERIQNYNMDFGLSNFGLAQQLQDYNIGMGRDEFGLRSQNQKNQYGLAQAGDARAQQLQDYNIGMGRDEFGLRSQNQAEQLKLAQAGNSRAQQLHEANMGFTLEDRKLAKEMLARRKHQEDVDQSKQYQREFDAAELMKRNEGRLVQDRADMSQRQHMADYNMRDSQKFMRDQIGLMNERIDARKPVAFRSNGAPRYGFGLRNGGEIRAATGYEYLVPDAPERVPGWIQEFNAKNRGTYVGRDKVKANEYAVAKRNAETTDRMANGGAYPGAVSMDAARNPYKRVTDLENMYDDAGYNPYTGVHDPSKKGWGAQWVASSKYRMRDGGDMLQTGQGGAVPGTGKGDKIPAKYEPGEFVVSNDMLAAEPELRDHLRALREQVLAAKGMTPEQADAKAIKVEGGGKEQKAGKKGFGIRAEGSFDGFFGPDFFGNKELDKRLAEGIAAQQAAEDAERNRVLVDARGNPRVGLDKWLDVTNGYTDVTKKADSSTPDVGDGGARDRQRPVEKAVQAATQDSRSQDFRGPVMDDSQITRPPAKDTPAVLQGATGKDVGFGITRFNVPGQSPLFTNMTDEEGMRSNDALISRKPQSDQDRIAGDNLSNRFAQRADAEARMAQRQAELQAEYERGQVDNRAIASSERQRELLNEQRNLERKIPRQEEAAGVNARIAALEKARLGEGENFGARENALVLDQARNAATIGVHAGDRASIERVADKELAAKAPGYALDNELSRQKIAAAQELKDLRDEYGKTNDPAKKAAIAERVRWLTGGKAEGGDHFDAKVLTDKNLNESLVTWDKRNGRIGPAGGGQGNRQATKEQVIAAANAKGITDPAALQQLFKHYGVE